MAPAQCRRYGEHHRHDARRVHLLYHRRFRADHEFQSLHCAVCGQHLPDDHRHRRRIRVSEQRHSPAGSSACPARTGMGTVWQRPISMASLLDPNDTGGGPVTRIDKVVDFTKGTFPITNNPQETSAPAGWARCSPASPTPIRSIPCPMTASGCGSTAKRSSTTGRITAPRQTPARLPCKPASATTSKWSSSRVSAARTRTFVLGLRLPAQADHPAKPALFRGARRPRADCGAGRLAGVSFLAWFRRARQATNVKRSNRPKAGRTRRSTPPARSRAPALTTPG